MKQADRIIELLGGARQASEILAAPVNTVRSWQTSGFIPAHRQDDVIECADKAGIKITPWDFFPGRRPAAPVRQERSRRSSRG